jgi:hypothetical protein
MNNPQDLAMCAYAGDSVASPQKVFDALVNLENRLSGRIEELEKAVRDLQGRVSVGSDTVYLSGSHPDRIHFHTNVELGKVNHFANVSKKVAPGTLVDTLIKVEEKVNPYRWGSEYDRIRLYLSAIADWIESQNNVGICDAMDAVEWLREEIDRG